MLVKFMEFHGGETVKIQHIKRTEDGNIMVMLNNIGRGAQEFEFRFIRQEIQSAAHVNVLEEIRETIPVEQGTVRVTVPGQSFCMVKLKMKESDLECLKQKGKTFI